MPDKSVLECRWGILGCGPEAASFVAELQSSSPSSSHSSPVVQHTIVAVSSRSISISQAFIDSHIRSTPSKASSSSTTTIEPFGTSTEIHAHPFIDSVFVASSQHSRYQEATSALRGGKSVLVSKPLAITSMEAKELCDLASRKDNSTTKWLGFIMRASSGKQPLLQAADECANGRAEGLIQSPLLPWSDSLAVLEALDELREAGAMRLPSEEEPISSLPQSNGHRSTSSAQSKRKISTDTARRSSSRATTSSDAALEECSNSATLRSQLQELRHVLRQRNALITALEERGGSSSAPRTKAASRVSLPPPRAANSSQKSRTPTNHRRHSSLDHSLPVAAGSFDDSDNDVSVQTGLTGINVLNTMNAPRSDSPSAVSAGRRKRKDANGGRRSSSHDRSSNALGLSTVKETNGSSLMLGEGFLAPTIASENRRMATKGGSPRLTANGLASPILSPGGGGKGTGKVIESLTTELTSARAALDDAKIQLRTSHRSITSLQRTLDETKETLGRSRSENERLGQMMTRKERQIQEALERARKAEIESKELGKSSRDWGTRVRKIEAELGEERILKQRAEVQYEAISSNWKQIREAWEKEMTQLRETQGDAVQRNREEVQTILAKFKAAEESWKGREEEGKVLKGIIQQLELERNRATVFVQGPVQELASQLKQHESIVKGQDAAVEEVQAELHRILKLMRNDTANTA